MAETTDVARLLVVIEANQKRFESEMKKVNQVVDQTGTGIERRFKGVNDNLRGQTANLAAQFQDIGVQLASGTSPLTVALQQGTQISAVLGEGRGGAAGAVKSLGAAFASVVSPVSLLTIGAIALGGALLQYLTGAGEKIPDLDDHLKTHANLIKDIKDAYGEAAAGVDAYAAKSVAVLETQLRASIRTLQAELEAAANSITSSATKITPSLASIEMGISEGVSPSEITAKYGAFSAAIRQLQEETARGEPNIRAFRDAVAAIANADPANAELQRLAQELLATTDGALKAQSALGEAQRAIALMGQTAAGEIGKIAELNKALQSLAQIGMPTLTDRQRALEGLRNAVGAAGGAEERRAAQSAYDAAVGRIGEREAETAAEKARREAERGARRGASSAARSDKRVGNEILELEQTTRALEREFELLGKSNFERDKARATREVMNLVEREGVTLTAEQSANVEEWASRYAQAAEKMRSAKDQMADMRDLSSTLSDAFQDLVLRGQSFDDVMKKVANRLASRSIDKLFDMLIMGPSGGGGGLLSLFGSGGARAGGGPVSANRAYRVGEVGPEVFVPRVPGTIVPNKDIGGSNVNITIDVTGATGNQEVKSMVQAGMNAAVAQSVQLVGRNAHSMFRKADVRFG
jgi:hypothetical protein